MLMNLLFLLKNFFLIRYQIILFFIILLKMGNIFISIKINDRSLSFHDDPIFELLMIYQLKIFFIKGFMLLNKQLHRSIYFQEHLRKDLHFMEIRLECFLIKIAQSQQCFQLFIFSMLIISAQAKEIMVLELEYEF